MNGCYNVRGVNKDLPENELSDNKNWSFEVFIVTVADEIAQRHHDVEDGIIEGILGKDTFLQV